MYRLLSALLLCGAVLLALPARAQEPDAAHDSRMAWWREARFGMFIHWGLYSQLAGEWKGKETQTLGEWIMNDLQIPIPEYEPLAAQFNPVKFNAAEWVGIAKNAGMKYIVITTKHHDGFCMWGTKLTPYNIVDATPFHRDPIKELAEECRKQGIKLCFYHSIMDWHHPDARAGGDFSKYIEHLKGQLRELLTNYGPIGVLWFDGEWTPEWKEENGQDLYAFVRSLQPDIIINNRVGKARDGMSGKSKYRGAGDFDTPEQEVPATGIPGDWETCETMNDTWGFKKNDDSWKSTRVLIRELAETASKGGNLLLNVGPTAEGVIPEPSVRRLAAMGAWLNAHEESIRGTTASPFTKLDFGRCTQRPGKLYLHVFDWPQDQKLRIPGLKNTVTRAAFLGNGNDSLTFERDGHDLVVSVPKKRPNRNDTVIALDIVGPPDVDNSASLIPPPAPGATVLLAKDAALTPGVELEHVEGHEYLGKWHGQSGTASWSLDVDPGSYRVELLMGCQPGNEGNTYSLSCGPASIRGTVPATTGWRDFTLLYAGTIKIAGPATLSISPAPGLKGPLINIQAVRLTPLR